MASDDRRRERAGRAGTGWCVTCSTGHTDVVVIRWLSAACLGERAAARVPTGGDRERHVVGAGRIAISSAGPVAS